MTQEAPRTRPSLRAPFRWRTYRTYIYKALGQDASPEHLALSFAVGVFCSILPFPGHALVAMGLSVVFNLNLLALVIGAWMNLLPALPLTYGFAFFVGGVITGTPVPAVDWSRMADVGYWWPLFSRHYMPLVVGTTAVGAAAAVVSYFLSLRLARRLHVIARVSLAAEIDTARSQP